MFVIGEKVILTDCPYDVQISEELEKYMMLKNKIQIIKEIKKTGEGTSGQWIKTDFEPEWIDSAWYKK